MSPDQGAAWQCAERSYRLEQVSCALVSRPTPERYCPRGIDRMAGGLDKKLALDDSESHKVAVGEESVVGRDVAAEHHVSNIPDKVAHLEEGTAEVHVTSGGLEGACRNRKDSILYDDNSDTHTVGNLHQDEAPCAGVTVMAIVSAPVCMTAAETSSLPPRFPDSCRVSLETCHLYSAMGFQRQV